MRADVLIIGVGPAGLAAAYERRHNGVRFRLIDQAERVASSWRRRHDQFRLNTHRRFSHQPGHHIPPQLGAFPARDEITSPIEYSHGGQVMIYHISFDYLPDTRENVHDRFRQTGGPPPDGVRMVGRWHAAEGNRGWLICESDDAEGIARWLHEWSNLISFEVTPVLTDDQFMGVISE